MRLSLFFFLLTATFVIGCAQQGVIVQKDSGPQPFYHSLGIDGSYAFLLRDSGGAVHRQIVTPEVFERYVVGDYFNDLQAPPAPRDGYDGKTVLPVTTTPPPLGPNLPPRIIKVRRANKSSRIAGGKHHTRKHPTRVARRKRRAPTGKVARLHRIHRVAGATASNASLVKVARSR